MPMFIRMKFMLVETHGTGTNLGDKIEFAVYVMCIKVGKRHCILDR